MNTIFKEFPDSTIHGANMGPIWVRQDPGGTHVGPLNFAIWVGLEQNAISIQFYLGRQNIIEMSGRTQLAYILPVTTFKINDKHDKHAKQ